MQYGVLCRSEERVQKEVKSRATLCRVFKANLLPFGRIMGCRYFGVVKHNPLLKMDRTLLAIENVLKEKVPSST